MGKITNHLPLLAIAGFFVAITLFISTNLDARDMLAVAESVGEFYDRNPFATILLFMIAYIVIAAVSLPFAGMMTIIAGAIFGARLGVPMVILSATAGSVVPFLVVRKKFSSSIRKKYPKASKFFVNEVNKSDGLYLLSARLAPILPFYVVNAVSGLTKISLQKYITISALGILPGTTLNVLAGSQIQQAVAQGQYVRPELILVLAGLGLFSFFTGWLHARQRTNRGS